METGAAAAADRRAEAERSVRDKSVINIHLLIAFAKIFGSRIEIVGSENSKESCQLCFDFEKSVRTDASGGRMPLHGYITQTIHTLFSCRYVLNHPLFDASPNMESHRQCIRRCIPQSVVVSDMSVESEGILCDLQADISGTHFVSLQPQASVFYEMRYCDNGVAVVAGLHVSSIGQGTENVIV
jgi:hypothetical protein